jgi:two-component system nitrate/nitrite response regulator NarL
MSARTRPITVVVADDHPVYRDGLFQAIRAREDLRLVAEAADGHQALDAIRRTKPDVALLDVRMPGLQGTGVLAELSEGRVRPRIVLLSAFDDSALVFDAIGAGAAGFLSKDADREDICDGIVAAAKGETVVSPELQSGFIREASHRRDGHRPLLTDREREVLTLTAEGYSAPRIAEELGIAATTVKSHLQSIYDKLEVADRAAMVAKAMRLGLLS